MLCLAGCGALLATTGCASHHYYAYAPPPPPVYAQQRPPLIQVAEQNGFRAGSNAGARDAVRGYGYHAKRDRDFHDAPGYDPTLGPFDAYRHAFRDAYLRGYDAGFRRE